MTRPRRFVWAIIALWVLVLTLPGIVQGHSSGGLPYTDTLFHGSVLNDHREFPCASNEYAYYGDPLAETAYGASRQRSYAILCPINTATITISFYDYRVYTGTVSKSGVVSAKWVLSARLGAVTCNGWLCLSNSEARVEAWLGMKDLTDQDRYETEFYNDACSYLCYKAYDNLAVYPSLAVYWDPSHSYQYWLNVKVTAWAWGFGSADANTWYTISYIKLQ